MRGARRGAAGRVCRVACRAQSARAAAARSHVRTSRCLALAHGTVTRVGGGGGSVRRGAAGAGGGHGRVERCAVRRVARAAEREQANAGVRVENRVARRTKSTHESGRSSEAGGVQCCFERSAVGRVARGAERADAAAGVRVRGSRREARAHGTATGASGG